MTTEPDPTGIPHANDHRPGLQIPIPAAADQEDGRSGGPRTPNAATMTCEEFLDLDDANKLAVIRAIWSRRTTRWPGMRRLRAWSPKGCQFLPDSTVNEVRAGGGPPSD